MDEHELGRNTAGEKLQFMINRFMEFRIQESQRLKNNPKLSYGDITTVNLTKLQGGFQSNVVPTKLSAIFDMRLAIDDDHEKFEKQVLMHNIEKSRFSIKL